MTSRLLHEGPAHVSVDGTLGNRFVLVSVMLVCAVTAILVFAGLRLRRRSARIPLVLAGGVLAVFSERLYHMVAFEFQSMAVGARVSTTFFGAPSRWIAPLVFASAAVISVLLKRRHRDRAPSV